MVFLKLPPAIGRAIFENTKLNSFFTFLNTDQNTQKKLRRKSAFKNDFGPQEVLELKMLSRRRLDIFSSSILEVQNHFWEQVIYKYCSKFYLEHFNRYLRKSKNGFPFVFSNLARPIVEGNFRDSICMWSVTCDMLWGIACFKMTLGSQNLMTFWHSMLHDITGWMPTKIRINEQKLTGWRFFEVYKGKAWIL